MSNGLPANGSVLYSPYLWRWQHEKGETEGRKDRPVCLLLAIPGARRAHILLFAISGTPPAAEQVALVVPPLERRRAGLLEWKEAWITVSEFNFDVGEGSWYFDPKTEISGKFSSAFIAKVALAARPFIAKSISRVDRA